MVMEQYEERIRELEERNRLLEEKYKQACQVVEDAKALEPYQAELIKLQKYIEKTGKKLIIVFEGRDAAGKGTLIATISMYMNPKHYRTVALGKPTQEQKNQWYFQRYVNHFPTAGEMVFFDRSWYNRAMVEPVFGFCTPQEHEVFMNDVIQFESSVVHSNTVLIKLYLSVNKSTQQDRFERRRTDPLRSWKLSEVDLQAQGYWDDFSTKKYKMLSQTDHADAPWYVIRSNNKHNARIEAMKLILNHFDYEDRNMSLSYEYDTSIVIPIETELKMMRETRKDLFS